MPIYEYECEACHERFEMLIRSISRRPETIECPACYSQQTRRLISAPAVHSGDKAETIETTATETTKPVFGRKELKAAQEKKRKLREQIKYGEGS